MKLLRKVLPAFALAGLISIVPVVASADDGVQTTQFRPSAAPTTFVTGSIAAAERNGHQVGVFASTNGLAPSTQYTVYTVVYTNPAACSGHFAIPGSGTRCGGPAVCPSATAPFDVCNPATGASVSSRVITTTATGAAYFFTYTRTSANAKGSEIDVLIGTPLAGGHFHTAQLALFPAPAAEPAEGDGGDRSGNFDS